MESISSISFSGNAAQPKDRILMIDDDKALCRMVSDYLSAEDFIVETVNSSIVGLERALSEDFSLVILDVMMPRLNGFEVLRQIRYVSQIPVMMLTARNSEVDRVVGLEIGADDYLLKPFSHRELLARLRAILRRVKSDFRETVETGTRMNSATRYLIVGDLEIDIAAHLVRQNGEKIELTNVEYDTLMMLINSAGRIVRRETLVRAVLGRDLSPFDRSIDTHISHLRKKLGHTYAEAERIKTIRGIGYIYFREPMI